MSSTLEKVKRYLQIEADYHDEDEDILDFLAFSIQEIKNKTGRGVMDNYSGSIVKTKISDILNEPEFTMCRHLCRDT